MRYLVLAAIFALSSCSTSRGDMVRNQYGYPVNAYMTWNGFRYQWKQLFPRDRESREIYQMMVDDTRWYMKTFHNDHHARGIFFDYIDQAEVALSNRDLEKARSLRSRLLRGVR